uniref:Protein phosphatase 1 regulatory inhibitor subunit 1C n=1 Tax=Gallus gallus TaxID=9031 RepID=A0A8V0ZVJ4_CHICK
MWNKGAAQLTQIHLLSRELQLLLRSTRSGSREGAEGAAEPGSALRHSRLCSHPPHLSTAMEPNSPKKIQFAVPLFQSQIDPEAAEQIRKRRPTPASLVIMNEHVPPDFSEWDYTEEMVAEWKRVERKGKNFLFKELGSRCFSTDQH